MKRVLFLLSFCILIAGCSPKVVTSLTTNYSSLDPTEEVVVLDMNKSDMIIKDAEQLGTIKIGDTGFTSTRAGAYDAVLELAKEQARRAGGNVVRITSHRHPDGHSTIHRITADILRVEDAHNIQFEDSVVESDHPDYAIIYFYRFSGMGALVSYDVHIGETSVYRSKVNSRAEVKVYDAGELEIWARTEAKTTLPLVVEKGGEYYIRCSVSMGAFVGRPDMELVQNAVGKGEYNSINSDR